MAEQATAAAQVTTAVGQHAQESDQAARGDGRTGAGDEGHRQRDGDIAKQIKLMSSGQPANTPAARTRVLTQLPRSGGSATATRGCPRDTRAAPSDLVQHAEATRAVAAAAKTRRPERAQRVQRPR